MIFKKYASSVSLELLESYLKKEGWEQLSFSKPRFFDCFQNTLCESLFQINVPNSKELDDYDYSFNQALNRLSYYENRDIDDLIQRILNPDCDIIKIRKNNSKIQNGTIPLDDAIDFFDNSKKLIASAAMDVSTKVKYRNGKYIKEVDSFLKKCRFGQTEEGSFIISIICPLDKEIIDDNQIALFDSFKDYENNFSRKVVNKLMKSIKNIQDAIDNGKDLSSFVNSIDDDFISLNFFENLSLLENEDSEGSLIEFKVERESSQKEDQSSDNVILVNQRVKSPLSSFVNEYKMKLQPDEVISVVGLVEDASAEPVIAQRKKGIIKIIDANNKQKKYNVELTLDEYKTALKAHEKGEQVFVSGTKKGRIITDTQLMVVGSIFDD